MNDIDKLKQIVEGALLAAGEPLSLNQLSGLFEDDEQPGHGTLREALAALDADCEKRAVELHEVAGGYRLQVRGNMMSWIGRLWAEKPPKYSRAMLETLAIIAYRQPITRGEIEQIRGVAVSSNILRTLQERDWVKSVGHRDVPGRPELLGTTKSFLDYFNLKSLDELPTLAEIKDLDNLEPELELPDPESDSGHAGKDQYESAQTQEDAAQDSAGNETTQDGDEQAGVGPEEDNDRPQSDAHYDDTRHAQAIRDDEKTDFATEESDEPPQVDADYDNTDATEEDRDKEATPQGNDEQPRESTDHPPAGAETGAQEAPAETATTQDRPDTWRRAGTGD